MQIASLYREIFPLCIQYWDCHWCQHEGELGYIATYVLDDTRIYPFPILMWSLTRLFWETSLQDLHYRTAPTNHHPKKYILFYTSFCFGWINISY